MSTVLKTSPQHPKPKPEKDSLSGALEETLREGAEKGITVSDLNDSLGDRGFGLLLIILSLPSALPVPAPGYSTPFGIVLALLGFQMLLGRQRPWLPKRAQNIQLSPKLCASMARGTTWFFSKIEYLIRPRLPAVHGHLGHLCLGGLTLCMACIMALPIPLTNTAPAMVIFIMGVGMTERDGFISLLSYIAGAGALLLYVGVLYIFVRYGTQGVLELKEILTEWFQSWQST